LIPFIDYLDNTRLLLLSPNGTDSHAMIRIINVKKLLSEIPFPKETNLVKRIKVTDSFFELNNVILELTVREGIPSLRDVEEFDEEISVETLTSMLFLTGNDIFSKPRALIFDKY
jgi:hypothetical protein